MSDPRQYDLNSWVTDIVPHLAYGLAMAATYEVLTRRGGRARL